LILPREIQSLYPYWGIWPLFDEWKPESTPQEPIQLVKKLMNEGHEVYVIRGHSVFEKDYFRYLESDQGLILKNFSPTFCKMQLYNGSKINSDEKPNYETLFYEGKIDEIRLSNSLHSADWINAEYCNQNGSCDFISIGDEENSNNDSWYDTNWSNRRTLTINSENVGSTLTNFPVLINLQDGDLINKVQPNGNDIFFTTLEGTKLAHEIEGQEISNGHITLWINVPSISSSENTILYMYYNNPNATLQENREETWNSSYKAVYHLKDNLHESTSNNDDGVNFGTTSTELKIGKGQYFDGNDKIDLGDIESSLFDGNNDKMTVSLWVESNNIEQKSALISKYNSQITPRDRVMYIFENQGEIEVRVNKIGMVTDYLSVITTEAGIVENEPYYLSVVFDLVGEDIIVYINGEEVSRNITVNKKAPIVFENNSESLKVGAVTLTASSLACY